jgi:uncharacterized lipoprotein YehR (DUF1307 family)
MNYRVYDIVLVLVLLVSLLFSVSTCRTNQQTYTSIGNLLQYKDSAKVYKSKSDKLVYYNENLEVSEKALKIAKDSLMKVIGDIKIKKPKTITKIVTEIIYKDIPVYYTDTLPCDTFNIPFTHVNDWITINGRSHNKGLDFENINITNDLLIVTGEKKNGLFKRNEQVVSVVSNNPYLKVTNLSNYSIKAKTPFYDKWWFKAALFGGGVIVGTRL